DLRRARARARGPWRSPTADQPPRPRRGRLAGSTARAASTAAGTRRAWHSRRRAMLLAVRGFATRGRSCCGAPFFDLCEGDDARSDEARNLRRRSECCALPKPIRLVPELVPKQIPSPTRFLATV